MTRTRRKLIEVALPLDAINKAAAREKSIRHGHRLPCICGGRAGHWPRRGRSSSRRWSTTRRRTVDVLLSDPTKKTGGAPDVLLNGMSKSSSRAPPGLTRGCFLRCRARVPARHFRPGDFASRVSGVGGGRLGAWACRSLDSSSPDAGSSSRRGCRPCPPLRSGRRACVEPTTVSRSPSSPFSMSCWWSRPRGLAGSLFAYVSARSSAAGTCRSARYRAAR